MSAAVPFRPSSGVTNDRYFIRPHVAVATSKWIKTTIAKAKIRVSRIEDPCAGSGEMSKHFTGVHAYDLSPEPNKHGIPVIQRDFLLHRQPHEAGLLMLMNVPYGKNSAGAIKFFNHAATFADTLAIVVPSTWARAHNTVIQRVNKLFHLVDQALLPQDSFYAPDTQDTIHDVPSAVQVWVRKSATRIDPPRKTSSAWFAAVQNQGTALDNQPDLAVRRVGYIGEVITSGFDELTTGGWWFITLLREPARVKQALNSIDWSSYGDRMGPQSINKTELINAVECWLATN